MKKIMLNVLWLINIVVLIICGLFLSPYLVTPAAKALASGVLFCGALHGILVGLKIGD